MDILFLFDLIGTIAFAVTGVIGGLRKHLDFIGALFCGIAAALGGGIIRDAILGVPAQTMTEDSYLIIAVVSSLLTYFFFQAVINRYKLFVYADAVGLAFFSLVGVSKALEYNLGFFQALFLGAITAVGGGMVRDVLIQRVPLVLQKELYVLPSLIGGAMFYALKDFIPLGWNFILSGSFILIVRILAFEKGWGLSTKNIGQESLFKDS